MSKARQTEAELARLVEQLRQRIVELERGSDPETGADLSRTAQYPREVSALLANLPGMAYRCRNDADWTMDVVSAGCLALTGYRPEELQPGGKVTYGQLIHPDDRKMVWDGVQAALAQRCAFQFEYRVRTAAGQTRWVWEQGGGVFSPDGGLRWLEGFITDVTARREAEAAVRASEARFRSVFENSAVPMALVDAAGRVVAANAADCAFLGYSAEELQRLTFEQITHPEDIEPDATWFAEVMRGVRDGYLLDKRYVRKDGAIVWGRLCVTLVRDEQNHPSHVIAVCQDITDRKRAEDGLQDARRQLEQQVRVRTAELSRALKQLEQELGERQRIEAALRASEAEHRALLEQLPHGVGVVQGRPARLVFANAAVAEITGRSVAELLADGDQPWIVFAPDQRAGIAERYAQRLAGTTEQPARYEVRVVRPDGGERWVEISSTRVQYRGAPAVRAMLVDVSARHRAEALLQAQRDVAVALGSAEELPGALRHLVAAVGRIPQVDAAGVYLVGPAGDVDLVAAHGLSADFVAGVRHFAADSPQARLVLAGRPVHARYVDLPTIAPERLREGLRAVSIFPVRHQGGVVAVLNLASRTTDAFAPDLLRTVETIATQIGGLVERLRARTTLREREELFRTVVGATRDAMVAIDEAARITLFNLAAQRMFGRSEGDALGQPVHVLLPPDFRDEHARMVQEYLATGVPRRALGQSIELHGRRPDGTTFPVELALSAGTRAGQRFVLAVLRDITERKGAEQALRQSETRYRALVEQIPAVVYTAAYAQLARTTYLSPQIEALLGFPRDIWQTDPDFWFKAVHAEDRERFTAELSRCEQAGAPLSLEYRVVAPGGRTLWVRDEGTFIRDEQGRLSYLQGVVFDITQRKSAEAERARLAEQLHEAQKMQAIGQVSAGIAHDFRNLLAVARQSVAKLEAKPASSHPEALHVLRQAIAEAMTCTESLLMFSRRLPSERVPLELSQFVEESTRILRHLLPPNITLEVNITGAGRMWVFGDAAQLQQVLLNLTLNARDAMPDGGRLEIALTPAPVADGPTDGDAPLPQAGSVRLVVRDSGVGITAELLPKIFEPFFTTKPGGRGTGLGLPTVQSIVQDHGGRVEVCSEFGRGATFTVVLPRCAPAHAAGAEPAPPAGHGELILLDEPDGQIRRLLVSSLCSWGYRVVSPAQGKTPEAVFEDNAGQVRILVLEGDQAASGRENWLQALRRAGDRTPAILMVSGSRAAVREAPDDWTTLLSRPFSVAELGKCVERMLEQSSENHGTR